MKEKIIALTSISLLLVPVVALAQPPETLPAVVTTPGDIIRIIETVANWLFVILLAVALIFILIAAYQFLTSGGDPTRVAAARQNLLYALVGIAVAFLARGLVALVRFVLGIPAP